MCDKNEPTINRLRKLIDDCGKTRLQIAKELKCDTSTITKHYNGKRGINADFIVKYAKYFNVSADYLLGLTECDLPLETDESNIVRSICDYTGLNKDVVYTLTHDLTVIVLLNYLLSEEKKTDLLMLCINLEAYRRKTEDYNNYLSHILNSDEPEKLTPETLWEQNQDYIDSLDLKEYQTEKALKAVRNTLFDFFNATDSELIKDHEALLNELWEKKYGNDTTKE